MQALINGKPTLHYRYFIAGPSNHQIVFPLNQEGCFYFFSARYALAAGIQSLGLKYGDEVLLPSYNCGTEVDPFLHLKIKPVFYRIKRNMDIDLDDLLQKISNNVKAILVTHFLGFPQLINEIKRIASERNLFLIEDCAHAFLSLHNGNHLGSFGDLAIFSLLKTLPIPNGGILLINNRNIKYNPNSEKPNRLSTFYYAAELLKNATRGEKHFLMEGGKRMLYRGSYLTALLARYIFAGVRKFTHNNSLYFVRPDSYLFIDKLRNWGISEVSRNIMNGQDFDEIKRIRRTNYEYLLNHFLTHGGKTLPFANLPPGVCPLFFPIILENSRQRNILYKLLKSRGVRINLWWSQFHPEVPWHSFPDAVYLKETLLGLPIHQDLTFEHLDHIIKEFENAYEVLGGSHPLDSPSGLISSERKLQ